jgi:hypothetical protein
MKSNSNPEPSPSLRIIVPAFLALRAGTIEGTQQIKKTIGAAFAGLSSAVPDGLPTTEETAQLLTDLSTLVDRVFVEHVNERVTLSGIVKKP